MLQIINKQEKCFLSTALLPLNHPNKVKFSFYIIVTSFNKFLSKSLYPSSCAQGFYPTSNQHLTVY
jgi:hypothetical protein